MNLKFTQNQKRIKFFVEQAKQNHLYMDYGLFRHVFNRPEHIKIAVAAVEGDEWIGLGMKFEPTSFRDFQMYQRYHLITEQGHYSFGRNLPNDIFHSPLDCGFYTKPQFRRKGVGRKLFRKLSLLSGTHLNYWKGSEVDCFFSKVAA